MVLYLGLAWLGLRYMSYLPVSQSCLNRRITLHNQGSHHWELSCSNRSSLQFDPTQANMFVSVLLLGLCVCFLLLKLKPQRPKNFPPGPPSLPVLGNLLHLNLQNPLKDVER
ncbi:hypothetical protein AMECASPLE_028913, partial [Ameca splendens]